MKIIGIKAKKVFAGPGNTAYVAEAYVEREDTGYRYYVTEQEYDGTEFTVAEDSVYAFLAEDQGEPVGEFMEEYTKLADTKSSEYAGVFALLNRTITAIRKAY